MRVLLALLIAVSFAACKNNGTNSSTAKAKTEAEKPKQTLNEIIVGAKLRDQAPNFQILAMDTKGDVLAVIFQYSGGCEEHTFNAHFNGAWMKSNPPKAMLTFEHLNPNNDSCRKLIKDTVLYDLTPLKYAAATEVVLISSQNKKAQTSYKY